MDQEKIKNICKAAYLMLSFCLPDILLRVLTRWLGYYSIFALEPNLFTFCWALLFVSMLSVLPGKRVGRIVYGVLYSLAAVYALTQYGYYLIFDKFYYWSNVGYTAEGMDYLSYVANTLNGEFYWMLGMLAAAGILGLILFPEFACAKKRVFGAASAVLMAVCGICWIPKLYERSPRPEMLFEDPAYEYRTFTNSGFDMELTGIYQYVFRDAVKTVEAGFQDRESLFLQVDTFLGGKPVHNGNEMTGLLEGKNLILVQMESMDDWLISSEVTPTIFQMMQQGISFSNFYVCSYGSGSTFATEFAANTGLYQNAQGTAAHAYTKSLFPYSLANLMGSLGYSPNSFHMNYGNFYNRDTMHKVLGYEAYHTTRDDVGDEFYAHVDESMILTDHCWERIAKSEPFFSFLITYSAHLPYTREDSLAQYALARYPHYADLDASGELIALYAKSRLTDDFFAALLTRLEEDGLMENTVIIAYADHQVYGLQDQSALQELSEKAGSSILEKVPAFIWYDGCTPLEVDKICQTVDLLPTIANLYGVDVTAHVPGSDIFDDAYEGIAIFPDGTWLTADAYVESGVLRWGDLSRERVETVNAYVSSFYRANEAILASDYYRYRTGDNN